MEGDWRLSLRSPEPFALTLRQLMRHRRLTFRQLAYLTGISAGYLNHLTSGSKGPPPDEQMELLAAALGVSPDCFLEYRRRRAEQVVTSRVELFDELHKVLFDGSPVTRRLIELLEEARENPSRSGRAA